MMFDIQSRIVSTVDAVSEALEHDIYSSKFGPGESITEFALVQKYGVSRNTVREAIARLVNKGIVEKVVNKGIRIKKITFDDVKEIFQLRKLFEVEAVNTIGKHGNIPDSLIKSLIRIKKLDVKKDWDSYVAADFDFHAALVDAAGSLRLSLLYDTISAEVKLCIYQSRHILATQRENAYDHSLIINHLKNNEVEQAVDIVTKHIDSAVNLFKEGFIKIESSKI